MTASKVGLYLIIPHTPKNAALSPFEAPRPLLRSGLHRISGGTPALRHSVHRFAVYS